MTANTRLGEFLLERGFISQQDLDMALAKQGELSKPLGEVLVKMNLLEEAKLAHVLAEQLNIPFVDLFTTPLQPKAVDLVPEHLARKYNCIPVRLSNGFLDVAMADPMDLDAIEELSKSADLEINPLISTRADIFESIELQYFTRNYRVSHAKKLENEIREEIIEENEEEDETRNTRLFATISNKGGVGKTHLSVNLSCAFAAMDMKTLLIDVDLGNANVGVKVGIHPKHTLLDFLNKEKDLSEIIMKTEYGFDLIGGQSGEYKLANLAYVQKLKFIRNFHEIGRNYDVVIFDLSAGIDSTVLDFALAANEVLIVTTPQDIVAGYACLKASYYRFKDLEQRLKKKMKDYESISTFAPRFIINQVDSVSGGQKVFDKIRATASKHLKDDDQYGLDLDYLGFIPYDRDAFREAEARRKPYISAFSNRAAARSFRKIAEELLKPPSMREHVHVVGPPPRPRRSAEVEVAKANNARGFRRFAEILRMKF